MRWLYICTDIGGGVVLRCCVCVGWLGQIGRVCLFPKRDNSLQGPIYRIIHCTICLLCAIFCVFQRGSTVTSKY